MGDGRGWRGTKKPLPSVDDQRVVHEGVTLLGWLREPVVVRLARA